MTENRQPMPLSGDSKRQLQAHAECHVMSRMENTKPSHRSHTLRRRLILVVCCILPLCVTDATAEKKPKQEPSKEAAPVEPIFEMLADGESPYPIADREDLSVNCGGGPWLLHSPKTGDVLIGITHGSGRAPQVGWVANWIQESVQKHGVDRLAWATKQQALGQ